MFEKTPQCRDFTCAASDRDSVGFQIRDESLDIGMFAGSKRALSDIVQEIGKLAEVATVCVDGVPTQFPSELEVIEVLGNDPPVGYDIFQNWTGIDFHELQTRIH